MSTVDVIVVGGGVTGCAVARDAAMRGLRVTLIEQGGIGAGTSGRFHSMLQSGSRYVATDVTYAAECMQERRIIERIAPFAFENTQGLFVMFEHDDPAFGEVFAEQAALAQIPVEHLTAAQIAAQEPNLAPTIGGYSVPDAVFRPWLMVPAIAESALHHGAEIRLYTRVLGIRAEPDGSKTIDIRNQDGSVESLVSSTVVLAAGTWTPDLAGQLGQKVDVEVSKGAMLVVPHRPFRSVINRCRPATSFDIAVPIVDATVFGTTSSTVSSPLDIEVSADEIECLTREFAQWWPGFTKSGGIWSTYAGVRPLVAKSPGEGGAVSRKHAVFDESDVGGVFSIVGGSFTTHRAMAEDVVNRVTTHLGLSVECRTADEELQPATSLAWSADAPMNTALFTHSA